MSAHAGSHPTLRPNKLLPPPRARGLPCIDEGHRVQYPLLLSSAGTESEGMALGNCKEVQVKQDYPSDDSMAYAFRQRLRGITAEGLEVLAARMQERSGLPPILWRVLGRYVGRRCSELPLPTLEYLLSTDMAVHCEDWHLIKSGLEVHLREFARCPDGEFGMAGHLAVLRVLGNLPRKVAGGLATPLGNFLARAVPLMDSKTIGEVCRLLLPLSRYGATEGWWNAASVKLASLGPNEEAVLKVEHLLEAAEVSKASRKLLGEILEDSAAASNSSGDVFLESLEAPVLLPPACNKETSSDAVNTTVGESVVRSTSMRPSRIALESSDMPKYPVYPLSSTPILWHLSPPHFSREVFNLTAHKVASSVST